MIVKILALIGLLTLICAFNVVLAAVIAYIGNRIEERDDAD